LTFHYFKPLLLNDKYPIYWICHSLRVSLRTMLVLDGKIASAAIKAQITSEVNIRKEAGKTAPHLAAIIVGDNPASKAYVGNKVKTCAELGFESTLHQLPTETTEEELIAIIQECNTNASIHGILVQLPLPKHISENKIIETILPAKDVDGFHPINVGKMNIGQDCFLPATPYGIVLMMQHFGIETNGKHAVVLGRSNIVGTPMSVLLSRNTPNGNCTVTLCHSRTKNLNHHLQQADIVIAAIGIPHFVKREMLKDGVVIIDVGINQIEAPEKKSGYRLVGDVDYEACSSMSSAITPVPGGVGLMTIAGLMQNTLKACKQQTNSID
jgi:methylenetetrahydrofolate dehydrogenase (NADP+) / methenyltetrahydrofolate cyclohydrolase